MKYNPHAPDWHKVAPDDISLEEYADAWIDMAPHIDTLRELASQAHTIVEFGLRGAVSTWAMLDGLPKNGRLIGVDIDPNAPIPARVRDDPRFTFVVGTSYSVALPVSKAQLVMIDSSHEFAETVCELMRAEDLEAKTIALHDYLYEPCNGTVQRAVDGFVGPHYLEPPAYRLDRVAPSKWGLAILVPR